MLTEQTSDSEKIVLGPAAREKPQPAKKNNAGMGCGIFIVIFVVVIFIIIFTAGKSDSSNTSSNSNYSSSVLVSGDRGYINNDVFVATTEENFDLMFDFITAKNNNGLNEMLLNGQIFSLTKGTSVNVLDSGFTKMKISSPSGSGWVPVEFVSK